MEVTFATQSRIKLRRVSAAHLFWIRMLALLLSFMHLGYFALCITQWT